MREIKFRAWHKFSEEIIPVVSIDFENQIINSKGPWRFFNEVELMQYTGLKDKNGVEIYEGDILRHTSFEWDIDSIYKVIWSKSHSGFDVYPWYDSETLFFSEYTEGDKTEFGEIEVIGNIFENRELLEGDAE